MTKTELIKAMEGMPDDAIVVFADSEQNDYYWRVEFVTFGPATYLLDWWKDTTTPAIILDNRDKKEG